MHIHDKWFNNCLLLHVLVAVSVLLFIDIMRVEKKQNTPSLQNVNTNYISFISFF